ncbi:MAG: hypothetical protein BECKG1743E_GA0114224_106682 [Candidatus Kentron sp. G]|nr:MAG: hypothetical protein BECKG1743E_GA0114224_106682 [Candidatus Kentron sp. G]
MESGLYRGISMEGCFCGVWNRGGVRELYAKVASHSLTACVENVLKGRIFYLGEGKLQFGFSFSWLVAPAATGAVALPGSISLLAIEKAGQDR